jgi:hypothetical protein
MIENRIEIIHLDEDFSINEFDNSLWQRAKEISIEKYWSGESAPTGRHARAKILWSDSALYVRFEANQNEPLIISQTPNLNSKTIGLWDRDVCEIFVAPDKNEPNRYYEFEIAPNGEWLDLGIRQLTDRRETDWEYYSGMQSAAKIETDKVIMTIKIGWEAFGKTPKIGDVWLGNLFRCVGSGETRGYLAWQPTKTLQPNFHVPDAFGKFEFTK